VSLRVRLGLLYGILLAVTLGLFSSVLYVTLLSSLRGQLDDGLRLRTEQVARGVSLGPDARLTPEDIPPERLGVPALSNPVTSGVVVQVVDDRGRVLATSDPRAHAPIVPLQTLVTPDGPSDVLTQAAGADGEGWRVLAHPIVAGDHAVGSIQAASPLAPLRATMRSVVTLLALGTALALSLAATVGWFLSGRALLPLRLITSTARAIAETGEIRERLRMEERSDEVGQLATAFNAMIARLDDAAQRQRAFLADTSHELRSPLTVLRGNLDLLRRDPDPDARLEYVRDADAEVRHMARLVNDLLLLAQSDARQSVHRVPLALDRVVRDVYEQALMLADGPSVLLDVDAEPWVLGDADRLKQLLWNLVENALRHTPNDGRVTISLRVSGAEALVRIADTGVGIPSEHLPHIFERFYKVDPARPRGQGGTGLGLAIVRYLAEAHGGRVDVESEVGVGSAFTVRLPLARADPSTPAPGSRAAQSARPA